MKPNEHSKEFYGILQDAYKLALLANTYVGAGYDTVKKLPHI